jgi:hypothetical protein
MVPEEEMKMVELTPEVPIEAPKKKEKEPLMSGLFD